MKIVLQRVKQASVTIENKVVGSIGPGILLLVGVHRDDTEPQASFLARKCAELRVFPDNDGTMNRSLKDTGGEALVVSQFTLFGDTSKWRRPSYIEAADPQKGYELYSFFVNELRGRGVAVATGIFGAMMDVALVNDGPVTLILEH
jgi:D-aminoacyl-tRNA deacylase